MRGRGVEVSKTLFYITSLYTFYGMYDEIIVTGVIGMRIIYDRNKSSRKR